ncbi:helix-turn-helix transcriptional regulator [Nocardioides sp. TF02-7]|uniref:helix-turn-helix domain-containing protein n=1 Tax=Nocardioides sp. TF02-7 TaxID=2917724 RepID=UPI001F070C35|nr:helix-turn-helix transcriptional regulator [Nocardioides sp. TF02-7]UMG93124.1 helix-turn-helix transcriptional regulator [Nocardioides sp. TF02-7]
MARALLAGGRWDEAEQLLAAAAGADVALDHVLAARLALGRHQEDEAMQRARAALAEVGRDRPEVACEAWEVLGRAARRDVVEAQAAFEEGHRLAEERGLVLWSCRLLAAMGSLDLVQRRPPKERLVAARRAALDAGAIATAARAELELDMARLQYHELDDAAASLDNAITMMERLHLPEVGQAYGIRATVHGLCDRMPEMEADIAVMGRSAGNEALLAVAVPAHVRSLVAIGHGRYEEAREHLARAMAGARRFPAYPLSLRGYWSLLETVLGGDGAAAREEVRAGPQASSPQNAFGLRCADAVALGRRGEREAAEETFADAGWDLPGAEPWLEIHARLLVARAAAADGWGEPEQWFRHALDGLLGLGQTEAASACRAAMREAGVAVPRRAAGSDRVPPHLQRLGVTAREYDVLELVVAGLSNRDIAERLFLSVRTVETHVARLLQRTGSAERGGLAAHLTG